MNKRYWSCVLLAACVAGAGCDEDTPDTEPAPPKVAEPSTPEPAEPSPPAAKEPAGPVITTDAFELRATGSDGYTAGELGQFAITLTGRGEWHVNQDFPFRVTVDAPEALKLPKRELGKVDAAEFVDERARVDVPFTAAEAGEHAVKADVEFAMCTDENCVPERHTVALVVPVQ